MIQWIMGGVRAVQAQVRTAAHDIEVEDIAMALVEYRNGAIGVIQGSTSFYPGLAERLEVHGKYGSVILEGDKPKLWRIDAEAAAEGLYGGGVLMQPTPSLHIHDQEDVVAAAASDPTALWGEQHRLQIEDFTRAIVDNREPEMTGRMALEPLKVILAIYESSRNGGARIEIQ
jgi:predicted dehydrogenase